MKKSVVALILVACILILTISGLIYKNNMQVTHSSAVKSQAEKNIQEEKNLYEKLNASSSISYAVIGDSIGKSTGSKEVSWHSVFNEGINKEYGSKAFETLVTKGGSTVYDGLLEYKKISNKKKIDLFFIIYGQNDQGFLTLEEYSFAYEKLVRTMIKDHPKTEIYAVIESSIQDSNDYPNALKEIALHYGLKVIDTREAFASSLLEYNQLTDDGVHPNDKGYKLYVDAFMNTVSKNITKKPTVEMAKEMHTPTGFNLVESKATSIDLVNGDTSTFQFSGSTLGFEVFTDSKQGKFSVEVDGESVREINANFPAPINRYLIAASGLSEGKHEAVITKIGSRAITIKSIVTTEKER